MNHPLDDLCEFFFEAVVDFKTGLLWLLSGITLISDLVFLGSIIDSNGGGFIKSNGGGGTEKSKSGGGTEKSGGGKAKFIGCFVSIGGGGTTGGSNFSIGFFFDGLVLESFFVATGIRFGYVFGENCGLYDTILIGFI